MASGKLVNNKLEEGGVVTFRIFSIYILYIFLNKGKSYLYLGHHKFTKHGATVVPCDQCTSTYETYEKFRENILNKTIDV